MIEQSEQIDKLAKALVAARNEMMTVGKSGENEYDRYKYATLYDYVAATKESMLKHGLMVVSSVDMCEPLGERPTAKGKIEYAYQVRMSVRIIHESGQWIGVSGVGHGQDRADKGVYQAITGARKYVMASIFCLATGDDPEATHKEGTINPPKSRRDAPVSATETRPMAKALAGFVQSWSGVQPEDLRDAVCALASRFDIKIGANGIGETEAEALLAACEKAADEGKSFMDIVRKESE